MDGLSVLGYRLEISSGLVTWEALEPSVASDDAIHFVDPKASETGVRFCRVRPITAVELYGEE